MINVVIFGLPGSGKSTQSRKITEKYGYAHISTGDLLRCEITSGSKLGLQIRKIIGKGELVSDQLIIDILEKEINKLGDIPGIIFDGFPRTWKQAGELKKMLNARGTEVSVMLSIEVDHDELIKRLMQRGTVAGRPDDNMEVIEKRIKLYHEVTAPVIEFYKEEGKYVPIDGTGSVEDIFGRIDAVLKSL